MQPWEFLDNLKSLQMAANNVVITSAAISYAVGAYTEFIGNGGDFSNIAPCVDKMRQCMNAHADALNAYCDIADRFKG